MSRLVTLLLVALAAASVSFAQFEYGEILGAIRDASGGVMTGAKVKSGASTPTRNASR